MTFNPSRPRTLLNLIIQILSESYSPWLLLVTVDRSVIRLSIFNAPDGCQISTEVHIMYCYRPSAFRFDPTAEADRYNMYTYNVVSDASKKLSTASL